MKILVGHTGFVGSNIAASAHFDEMFNSSNIKDAFGLNPDMLIYSGVRAEKFLANKDPEGDRAIIEDAIENIKKINPKLIVLISTVDVYPEPSAVDENTLIEECLLQPYGKNRLMLERWVESNIENHLIIRLPGLFGRNLKKNFIFDIITFIPAMLKDDAYQHYSVNEIISRSYDNAGNGFYKLKPVTEEERAQLKLAFKSVGFSALNFTDSRAIFQFYNLENLWKDINTLLKAGIKKMNMATEPLSAAELYKAVFNTVFVNELANPVPFYNFHTNNAAVLGEEGCYIAKKSEVLDSIITFIKNALKHENSDI